MARTKQQDTIRVVYARDGAIEELRGKAFNVPATLTNPGAWIESRWREDQARLAAEAEREARNAAVLADRQEQVRQAEELQLRDELSAELATVRAELADVRQQVASPDERRLLEVNQNTTACMGRVLDAADKVAALVDRVEELDARAQEHAALADADRQVSLDLLRNQIELLNGISRTTADAITEARMAATEATQQAINLSSEINANWEAVESARNINERAITMATAAARDLVATEMEQFRTVLSLVLMAVGVGKSDIENQLVRMQQGMQPDQFILTPAFIRDAVRIGQAFQDAKDDAVRRDVKASAESAGRLLPKAPMFG